MSHTAIITLGKLVTEDIMMNLDDLKPGTELFQRGSLKLGSAVQKPGEATPVCVNHDKNRVIGHVLELMNLDDTDAEWLAALCVIEHPPSWLGRGTAASVCFTPVERYNLGPGSRIIRGYCVEVSVLRAGSSSGRTFGEGLVVQAPRGAQAGRRPKAQWSTGSPTSPPRASSADPTSAKCWRCADGDPTHSRPTVGHPR